MSDQPRFLLYTKTGSVYGWVEAVAQKEGMVEIPAEEAFKILATGKPRPMDKPVSIPEVAPVAAAPAMAVGMAPDPAVIANRDLADQPERSPLKVKKAAPKGPFDK